MKKYVISFFAAALLVGLSGCDVVKNSYESQYLDCTAHCQSQGLVMDTDVTKRTNTCRCS